MENRTIIATALNEHVRIYILNAKKLVEDARKKHDLYPTSLAALGRTLSVSALMGLMLKGENETVTVTINGNGPIGTIMAVAQNNGDVKGFVGDNEIYLKYNSNNKLAVGLAVGNEGYLKVTKDLDMRQNYTSQVALQTGEIGDDFAYYFSVSEQRPTIVSTGVLVDKDYSCLSAGALIIEVMPDALEEDIVYLEELARKLKPISSMLLESDDLEMHLKGMFEDLQILEEREVRYHCDCSRERFLRNFLTLPKSDLEELALDAEKEDIEVRCEFCNSRYHYSKKDMDKLLKYAKNR